MYLTSEGDFSFTQLLLYSSSRVFSASLTEACFAECRNFASGQ